MLQRVLATDLVFKNSSNPPCEQIIIHMVLATDLVLKNSTPTHSKNRTFHAHSTAVQSRYSYKALTHLKKRTGPHATLGKEIVFSNCPIPNLKTEFLAYFIFNFSKVV
jgi:hypothetical protein